MVSPREAERRPQADFDVDTPIDRDFHQIPSEKLARWESTLPPEYWEYRAKWEQNPKNQVVGLFPIHLDIEATSNCNLACTMCPRTEMVGKGTFWRIQNFDFELYKRLIDEGVKNGLCSVKYNFLGEPTLNPRLPEMIRYAKEKGLTDLMINTNATRLTEDYCRKLIESGLDKIFFSFDSPYREHFNSIRVKGDYDEILENIKRFVRIRHEMGSVKPFTRVSMVRMKENEAEWEDFKRLFEPIVDAVAYGDYNDHSGQSNPGKNPSDYKGRKKAKFCCPQLWQRMFVHPDGLATVCCVDADRELIVGNVLQNTAQEIWLGEPYQRLRRLHAEGRFDEIPTCARCPLAHY